MRFGESSWSRWILWVASLSVGWICLVLWLRTSSPSGIEPRIPETSRDSKRVAVPNGPEIEVAGEWIPGPGTPGSMHGSWPQFRGPNRDNIAPSEASLSRKWGDSGLPELWRIEVGEGHAGPVIHGGRLYLMDYDREGEKDAIRCLSAEDGEEIWRYAYPVKIKRNHGMSRTVPAVTDEYVVTLGPKCHVHCLQMETGELFWKKDLVREHGTQVPAWYAGQCPLIDGDLVVLAPGADPLMMGIELASGEVVWKTPNPNRWGMTHSSIVVLDHPQGRQYIYCTTQGVVGVSAQDGSLLWSLPDWKITIANIPSPVPVGTDRVFLAGGYRSGCMMVRIHGPKSAKEPFYPEILFRLDHKEFGSEQHTCILYGDHIYGIIPTGEMACMSLEGQILWRSGQEAKFGLGPFLAVDGLILVLQDQKGTLHMVKASEETYEELGMAQVFRGHDAWGPMAMVGQRLFLRDLTELVCLRLPKR